MFTTRIRINDGVCLVHIPKDLAAVWGLKTGDSAEMEIRKVYHKKSESTGERKGARIAEPARGATGGGKLGSQRPAAPVDAIPEFPETKTVIQRY